MHIFIIILRQFNFYVFLDNFIDLNKMYAMSGLFIDKCGIKSSLYFFLITKHYSNAYA